MDWFIHEVDQTSENKLTYLFTVLDRWFKSNDFNGCAFINASGEIGDHKSLIRQVAKEHKTNLKNYLYFLCEQYHAADPGKLSEKLLLLVDGAIVVAHVLGDPQAASNGLAIAKALISTENIDD